jgi:hypothetical protein
MIIDGIRIPDSPEEIIAHIPHIADRSSDFTENTRQVPGIDEDEREDEDRDYFRKPDSEHADALSLYRGYYNRILAAASALGGLFFYDPYVKK